MTGSEIRKEMISAREEYIDIIRAELLGPGSEFSLPDAEHELISSTPTSRYSVGILFPQGNEVSQDNDETVPIEETGAEQAEIPGEATRADDPVATKKQRTYEKDDTADENLDEEIGMSTQYMPSSMGITFLVKGDCDQVRGRLTFATYRNAKVPDCEIPYFPDDPETYTVPSELAHLIAFDKERGVLRLIASITAKEVRSIFERDTIPEAEFQILQKIAYRFVDYCSMGYVRVPHEVPEFVLDFSSGDYADNEENHNLDGTDAKLVALRRKLAEGLWSVTVMLVNGLSESPVKANRCIFQSRIEIGTHNNGFVFVESNPNSDISAMDDEERSLDLLYRHKKIYGTGLGTSVDWTIDDKGNGTIWNDFFPITEVPSMSFSLPKNDLLGDGELSMKYLSDLDSSDRETKLKSMHSLVDLYKLWVEDLEKAAAKLDARYASAAAKNIQECKRAYQRMYAGIETLRSNDNAYRAFLLANRAMFMQRIHIAMQGEMAQSNADRYPGDEEISDRLCGMDYSRESDANCRWRPFQIAFLLMDVNSIADDQSPERSIVDLIWFPTGGGKTEAYLGLTAFTIFYRKLAHPKQSAGTAVIMRYTLRLLAAQQFTRAATLICACEYIRQDCAQKRHRYPAYPLGKTPITIGLWIGGTHIPNKNEDADFHLGNL